MPLPASPPDLRSLTPSTYPNLAVDALLADHADLVQRIRLCFGLARERFEADVQPLIERYAAQVHLLPATANNHFAHPGGLLRLGLETAFFSLQGTDAHIISGRATISERRQLEPRWRLATFVAGLCSELHRTVNQLQVTAAHPQPHRPEFDGSPPTWPACQCPLIAWLSAQAIDQYQVRWQHGAPEWRGLGLFVLPHVVPGQLLHFLAEGNSVVLPHLLSSVSGVPLLREHNMLDALVRRSLALVIDRDLRAHAAASGQTLRGDHLARYVVHAMQRLTATAASWQPNANKSRLWWGQDGLYLLWPQAAADIRAALETEQLAGMPTDADAVLAVLVAEGVVGAPPNASPMSPTTPIRLPGTRSALQAVRLVAPDLLTAFAPVGSEPLAQTLALSPMLQDAAPSSQDQPLDQPESADPTQLAKPPASARTAPELRPAGPVEQPDLFAATEDSSAAEQDPAESPAPLPAPPPAAAPPRLESPAQALLQQPDASAPALAPSMAALRLMAPMRLNLVVRDAIASIVEAATQDDPACETAVDPQGLFVALSAILQRGVQPSVAARALQDAGMLAEAAGVTEDGPGQGLRGNSLIRSRLLGGQPTQGIVIAGRWIDGWASQASLTAPASTSQHHEPARQIPC